MLVFSSQPTELPQILAKDQPKSHGKTSVLDDYVQITYCEVVSTNTS
jgi:hypothetical protein